MGQKLHPITGTPIDLLNLPEGCPFAPRCEKAMKICIKHPAESMDINAFHKASCWLNVKDLCEKQQPASVVSAQEGGEA